MATTLVPYDPASPYADQLGRLYIHKAEELDQRSLLQRAQSRFFAYLRLGFMYGTFNFFRDAPMPVCSVPEDGKTGNWGKNTSAFYILLHGIGGRPIHWTHYVDEIAKLDENAAFYRPDSEEMWDSEPEDTAHLIMRNIVEDLEMAPNAPVCVISFSNGARVSSALDVLLDARGHTSHFITIAGLCFGTFWVSIFNSTFWFAGYTPALEKQVVGNDEARRNIELIRGLRNKHRRAYFMSTEDGRIWPWNASAPHIGGEEVFVLHGLLHEELFEVIAPLVASKAVEFCHDDKWTRMNTIMEGGNESGSEADAEEFMKKT